VKDIDTLEPKGIGKGFHRGVWWNAIKTTSEERQTLSHQFVYRTELGKTKLLHLFFYKNKVVRRLQNQLKVMWLKDAVKSESFVVMTKIEVRTLPHSKEGRLTVGALSREPCD